MQQSRPVHRRGSGACPDTRRSNKLCATTISTHSVSPDSMSLPKLNPVEPPWYGPVCPVVGEGWHREVSPYPDPRVESCRSFPAASFPEVCQIQTLAPQANTSLFDHFVGEGDRLHGLGIEDQFELRGLFHA